MKFLDLIFGLIRIPLDYLMAMTAFTLAFQLRQITDLVPGLDLPITYTLFPDWNTYLLSSALFSLGLIAINAFNGNYSLKKQENLSKQITKVLVNNTIWLFAIITYYFFVRSFPFSRLVFLETWLISILTISLGRILINWLQNSLYKSGRDQTKLLFIGSPQLFPDILNNFKKDPRYKIVGYVDQSQSPTANLKYRGPITMLEKIVKKSHVEKIIQLDP
ncbi:MAG: nucleoside-diphosphate sugar epimerase/dehydratase, partial [Candidatus Altimarinota bacterium]